MSDVLKESQEELKAWRRVALYDPSDKKIVEEMVHVVSLLQQATPDEISKINEQLSKSDALIEGLQEEIELRRKQRTWIKQQLISRLKEKSDE